MIRSTGRFDEDATLVRESAGERDADGIFRPGLVSEFELKVASAPSLSSSTPGESRSPLMQGARHREERVFWLPVDARALRRGDARTDSDFLRYNDQMFRVAEVSDWGSFVEVVGVVPDEGDEAVPTGSLGFNDAPVIFPVEIVEGDTHIVYLEVPAGEVTTIDTELPRAQIETYHTIALSAIFPNFIQLISVPYLLTHDGLDTAIGYFHFEHTVDIEVELRDTLVLVFDLTRTEDAVGFFQIRGIG